MNKTLLVIPGFGETTKEKPYQSIIKYAESIGYKTVVEINPVWNYRTMSDWHQDVLIKIKKLNPQQIDAIGFSFGAYILTLLVKHIPLNKVIYGSLSPFFKEQLSHTPKEAQEFFGKRRMQDFKNHTLASKLLSKKNIFLFGDTDWPYAIEEARKHAKKHNASFELIKDSGHELTELYLNKIKILLQE